MVSAVPNLRVSEAAALLGVSDDTVRRWIDQGRLPSKQESGRMAVDGQALAAFAQELADSPEPGHTAAASARNRMRGIVTRVLKDGVMAQVEMQAGPFQIGRASCRERV